MTATTPLSPSLDPTAWRPAIDAHLAAGHTRLGGRIVPVGPLRLFANPDYEWTFFNTARQARAMGDDEVPALLPRVMDFYTELGLRPAWDVSAALSPQGLVSQLTAARFVMDRYETLMAWAPGAAPTPVRGNRAIHPYEVTAANLDVFVRAWQPGFAIGAETNLAQVRRLFLRDLASGWQFWCADRDGFPIGTLAALSLDGVTQLANISTVPAARRQGVASALMRHALDRAAAAGDRLVYLHAATGSAAERLYRRLGFQSLDHWMTYVHDPFPLG